MLLFLLGCASVPLDAPETLFRLSAMSAEADPVTIDHADADVPLGVMLTLEADTDTFSGWTT
jgi:hypothetical protein